jgi:hypothetical protein
MPWGFELEVIRVRFCTKVLHSLCIQGLLESRSW